MEAPSDNREMWKLEAETELRVELSDEASALSVAVTLLEGSAEVFGVPLVAGQQYTWG